MPDESTRTVLVALGAGLAVALAKVGAAVVTGSTAMAAEAAHSLADTGNDLFLFIAQRRSSRPPDDQHPLGHGVGCGGGAPGSIARWDGFAAASRLAGPGRRSSFATPPKATTTLMSELWP
jgi:hypothetical protein